MNEEIKKEFEKLYTHGIWLEFSNAEGKMLDQYIKNLEKENKQLKEQLRLDEWEDIEKIEFKPRKVQNAINKLIKNQKYLKERLDKNDGK